MSQQAGIWIDLEHAIVILINETGHVIKKFHTSNIQAFPPTIQSIAQHAYTPRDFVPEDRLERKGENSRKQMHDEVLKFTQSAKSYFILGPGEAKGEFVKRLSATHQNSSDINIETSDKLTDPQLAAKVTSHFAAVGSNQTSIN